jgi:signal transduction histidine kinase
LLNIAMIHIGGGFNSPFYYLLFTVTISAAMRYGYGPSLATVLLVIGLDALENLPTNHALDAPFVFRSGFLLITAALAGYLRAQARRAEGALQERLRQAHLLNAATAMLGASLEVEPVLQAVAAAACHLLGGTSAVLQSSASLENATGDAHTVIHDPAAAPAKAELVALCRRYARMESWPPATWASPTARHEGPLAGLSPAVPAGHEAGALACAQRTERGRRPASGRDTHIVCRDALPGGQQAVVLMLTLPTRQTTLATLAVLVPPGQLSPTLDTDILDSFVERTTLAIENASLYRTLASRSQDLQRAYSDLATAHQDLLSVDEMKTNFLANVSHELRTPLSSIRSFSELLLSYDDPAVQQEFIQIINTESERLTRLVNDVLDITRIEAGQMDWHMTTVDVAALVRESARPYATLIKEQGLVFEQEIGDALPPIEADRDRLQQVMGNLLGNALKFTPTGMIRLSAQRVGAEIHIAVTDTGIGIAAEDQERIFEKFQQVGDSLTDKPRGTGLGLCICRDIVAYHNGRLWVESQRGAGSTFTLALPATDTAARPPVHAAWAA